MRVGVEGARGARVRNAVDQRRINELITHALISEHGLADLVAKVTEAESVCVQQIQTKLLSSMDVIVTTNHVHGNKKELKGHLFHTHKCISYQLVDALKQCLKQVNATSLHSS